MININLIPDELRKKKKYQFVAAAFKDIPLEITIGSLGGFLALLVAVNILLQLLIFVGIANQKRLELSWQMMGPQRIQIDKITNELEGSRQKITTIENIKNGMRISWAQKLNIISDRILPGIWLNRLSLDKDKLLIEGNSVSKKGDYSANVNRFNAALKNEKSFTEGIEGIEVSSVARKKINDVWIASFTMTATLDKNYEQIFIP